MTRLLLGFGAALALFAATTWLALESGGVAVVTTRARDGTPRETHVWFAEIGGELWLEAGAPENPWFVDVLTWPLLRIALPGEEPRELAAVPDREVSSQRRVRESLHAKYGWRDAWVGLLVDASRSVAVRLVPVR